MHRFIFWGSYPMGNCTLVSLIFVSHSHDPIGGATYDAQRQALLRQRSGHGPTDIQAPTLGS